MTKSELIERIAARQTQLSAKDVELAVKTLIEQMSETLAAGHRIEIRGFGSFSLHYRAPRIGRNPKTGESVGLVHRQAFTFGEDEPLTLDSGRTLGPVTLAMDILRGRTPEMVHKEIYVHLLSYNLIRTVMAQAAEQVQVSPRQLSFKGAVQLLNAFRDKFLSAPSAEQRQHLYRQMLQAIARHRIGQRPGRCEPRAVKRRPKAYPRLMVPRAQARAELLAQAKAA